MSYVCKLVCTFHDGCKKESISKFFIGNRFHIKLRILSPENYKQSLQVKSWKAEVTAEKKQTQDYNQNFVIQAHKLQNFDSLEFVFFLCCYFSLSTFHL